jgi:hypothetical protein
MKITNIIQICEINKEKQKKLKPVTGPVTSRAARLSRQRSPGK